VTTNGLETTRKEVIVHNLRYHPIIFLRRVRRININLRRDSKWVSPKYKGRGTAILVQAWTGPEVSRSWGSQISWYSAHEGGKVVSPTQRPPLPPENTPGIHFCYRLSRPQGNSAAGRIMSTKEIPIIPPGIELATFRFAGQCLQNANQNIFRFSRLWRWSVLLLSTCSCELCRIYSYKNTFKKWIQCQVYVNGKLSKTKAQTLQRRRWRVLRKISNIFLLYDRTEADMPDVFPCFTKDEDRRYYLEPGQVTNEWGWRSPLDMTTYTGLKETGK
jgi:hypothetical protein